MPVNQVELLRPARTDTGVDDRFRVYYIHQCALLRIDGIKFESELPHNAGEAESINQVISSLLAAVEWAHFRNRQPIKS